MTIFKNKILCTAVLLLISVPAMAVTPKSENTIMQDKITLADVFDDVGSKGSFYLAPAPAMGKSIVLDAADLTRISQALNLGWTSADNSERVVIRRSVTEISRDDIKASLEDKLSAEMKGKPFEMEMANPNLTLSIPEDANKDILISGFNYDPISRQFKATVSAAAMPSIKKEVKGKVYTMQQVPVMREPKRPGDVIAKSDIDYISIRDNQVSGNMIVDAAKMIGQTPKHGISAMKPMVISDIAAPMVVKKGDIVTMALKNSVLSLTTQGKALEDGAAGDTVRIMNLASKQVIEGVVTGAQAVSIRSPSNALSLNTL